MHIDRMWWHHWREKRTFFQWMNWRSLSLSGVDASACSSTFLRSRRNDIIAIANADYIICAWTKRQFSQLNLVTPRIQGGEQSVYNPYFEELFDILLGHHYFASQTTNSICTTLISFTTVQDAFSNPLPPLFSLRFRSRHRQLRGQVQHRGYNCFFQPDLWSKAFRPTWHNLHPRRDL